MVQVSLSTSTDFAGDLNALVEDQETALTVRFDLDEPAPSGGLRVYVDSEVTEILNRLNFTQLVNDFLGGATDRVENIVAFPIPQRNDDRSGIALTIAEGAESAFFTIDVLNQDESVPPQAPYDGRVDVEFSLLTADQIPAVDQGTITGVSDYTVDANATSSTVIFADTESQLPGGSPEPPEPVENSDPVATDDRYDVITAPGVEDPNFEVPTELTVDAAGGVLANDTDVDGDDLTVAIASPPENGSVALNGDGSFTYTPTNGFSTGEQDGFTYTVSDGNGGSDTGNVVIEAVAAPSPPPPTDDPIVGVSVSPTAVSEEDASTTVITTFTVEGEIPTPEFDADGNLVSGGLSVLFQGPLVEILDELSGDVVFTGLSIGSFFDLGQGIFEVILFENTAALELNLLNDVIQEEDQVATFSLIENTGAIDSSYAIDPEASTTSVTITDGNGGPGIGPTIGFSVSETELAEGDTFTINFDVNGEIPTEGVTVLVDSPTQFALGEFNIFNEDGIPAFESTGLAGVPEVGDIGASSFLATLTEPDASITISVFDDGPGEGAEAITFNLADGEVYEVSETAGSVSFTIDDTVSGTPTEPENPLPERVITILDEALDNNLPPDAPGAAVAILTPEGEWFGASGVSDLENNVPLEPNDRFEAGSITKTFVATIILQLVEEEQLSLDDTLTDWLDTTFTDLVPNAEEITIEQILNHTSGIADFTDGLFGQALSDPTLFLNEWTPEQLVGFIDGVDPLFAPGTDWQYSNTNYILAGEVIEAVTGNSYGSEIRDRIIEPLGLDNTFVFGEDEIPGGYINSYWDFDNNGTLDNVGIANLSWAGSAGSIISNTEDLADFFDGLLVEDALLQPETLEQMLDTIEVNSPNYDSYGLGIGTLESRNRFWYVHRGQTLGFRSNLWYSPLEEITYVELLNGRSSSNLVSDLLPTYRRAIQPPTPDIVTYEFEWTGQIAEFSVTGEFSYDAGQSFNFEEGIVREEDLESFDISFFGPDGVLMRTYEDNHLTFPEFNFAFDTNTKQILTDGIFTEPDGLNVGERTAIGDGFTGLNLWSKSKETSSSLIHFDDWSDEFGYEPIGYSTHEDIAFLTLTTAELIETGKVGETYLDDIQDTLDELGSPIIVSPPANEDGSFEVVDGATSLFLNFTLFETAGLIIQNATPTADTFSNQFQIAFAIEPTTDFTFDAVPDLTAGGTINHTGDITFLVGDDTLLTIGDFAIGYDESRINDTNSGFFVADTLDDGLGIDVLFDVSNPDRFLVTENDLTVADADLLLAPELATVLGLNDFVGADIGDTRIDAEIVKAGPPLEASVTVDFSTTEFIEELGTPFPGEVEDPQALTVTFTVEGDLPDGVNPVLNFASSEPDGLTRFSLTELQTDGLTAVADIINFELSDAEITLLEPVSSFTIPLFDFPTDRDLDSDGIVEDFAGQTEMVDFTITSLTDGVTINPDTQVFTGTFFETVADAEPTLPVVSLSITPDVVAEDSDNPSFVGTITVDGEIPEAGLPVIIGGSFLTQPPRLFDDNVPAPWLPEGSFEITGPPVFDAAGNLTGFTVTVFESTTSSNPFIFDDIVEEDPIDLVYSILPGEGYTVGQGDAPLRIIDGPSVIPGSGPTVSLSVDNTDLAEGESFTVSFDVDGDIPEGGLQVFVDGPAAALSEFNIFGEEGIDPATDIVGMAGLPEPDNDAGGFFAILTENQASITLSPFDDGPNEGPESLTFELVNGEVYEVGAGSITLTINDVDIAGTDAGETLVGDEADNSIAGVAGDDNVAGGLGNDIILGGEGDDVLRGDQNSRSPQDGGNGGNDIIFGGEGNDRIGGKAGNDILSGDAGDDTIYGDDGDDILMGVTGNDILIGDNFSDGSGSDLFVFGSGDGTDTVLDFEVGIDRIGIVEGEFTFADVTLTQDGANTLLGVADETLAVLNNVQSSALGESDFVIVPDVSNPEQALALI